MVKSVLPNNVYVIHRITIIVKLYWLFYIQIWSC